MNYTEVLQELGVTQDDMDKFGALCKTPMLTKEESAVYFAHSSIEGDGTFAIRDIQNGERIAPLRQNNAWTLTGMLTNHSGEPNTRFDSGDLIATKDISKHNELTVDYLAVKKQLTGGAALTAQVLP